MPAPAAESAVQKHFQRGIVLPVEVEHHRAHLRLGVRPVGVPPVGQAVRYGPIRLLELPQNLLVAVLKQDSAPYYAVERPEYYRIRFMDLRTDLRASLDESRAESEDVSVHLHGGHLGSAVLPQNVLQQRKPPFSRRAAVPRGIAKLRFASSKKLKKIRERGRWKTLRVYAPSALSATFQPRSAPPPFFLSGKSA